MRTARMSSALVVCVATLMACSGPSSRYRAQNFRTTRSNFVYVRDRVTGEWMNRHCELRVPVPRPLPDPLRTEDHGDALSVQLHDPVSVRTAGLRSIDFAVRDGFRGWVIDDVLDEAGFLKRWTGKSDFPPGGTHHVAITLTSPKSFEAVSPSSRRSI